MSRLDAVVVGAGPNGLTAAARLAREGRRVLVLERNPTVGGASRTVPFADGAVADWGAAVHAFGAVSPAFAELDLETYGVRWLRPAVPVAHPLDDGSSPALLAGDDAPTLALGADAHRWARLVRPLLRRSTGVLEVALAPILRWPPDPAALALFGPPAVLPATVLARALRGEPARALLAGHAAHAMIPLSHPFTGGLGLALALTAHLGGWPVAEGGSQAIVDALAAVVRRHGGEIVTGQEVRALADLPPAGAVLLDLTPRQVVALAGDRLRGWGARRYRRWRYGPGACRLDLLLAGPLPWTAEPCRRAGTVHLGGTLDEIAAAEAETVAGRLPRRPFVLVAQPSLVDPSRAPTGQHVVWAYCHVPAGSAVDASPAIEAQLDRFAPGWRGLVVARRVTTGIDLERGDPNLVGGDIAGGSVGGTQLLARPRLRPDPYRTPVPGVWLCSSSTPPGGGVHGMCGWHAADSVLRRT